MAILGISAFFHDSAAALLLGGEPAFAAQEERFTGIRHDASFPEKAIRYCLEEAGLTLHELDAVVFYEKPFLKFERLIETYVAFAPYGFKSFQRSMPVWLKEKLFQRSHLNRRLTEIDPDFDFRSNLLFSEHHYSHAASAYYPSPFNEAVVLTMDGVGEWSTSTVAIGRGDVLETQKEIHFPHSLGLLYSAFTYYTGFKVNSGEYKVMGLAPYGEPSFKELILKHLIDLKPDGSFRLNQAYFNYATGLTMTNRRFDDLFGGPARKEHEPLEQRHMDLAASIQAVAEEVMLTLTRSLANEYQIPNLCLAGGVALNCVANGQLLRDGAFENIWVQPAAGDAGAALGAAYAAYHRHFQRPRAPRTDRDGMKGAYLGPSFSQSEIEEQLNRSGAVFSILADEALLQQTALELADGAAIGWMQGRMEFGPRALGNRSIIADPRSLSMQQTLNLKVKYRESFRPFAPAILREDVADYFDIDVDSPYMSMVAEVVGKRRKPLSEEDLSRSGMDLLRIPRSDIPAVTHVDYSARVQTVHDDTNPRFAALLRAFKQETGCSVLVNTSFNIRGEPIVCTPKDAYRCFMGTELDVLVVGNCFLRKEAQPEALRIDYRNRVAMD